ncbi:MAG TPA: penicillin-binding transpeptidase domain-containing protein, partial [Parvularculaceae bacterium]|nr:penicillin-binding transpeptidase domain-containing protein [Parvularculaceae bacterium]
CCSISFITPKGHLLYARANRAPSRVVDARYAGMMNEMLQQTLAYGTAKHASLPGWPAAGKTGTSQDFRDAWFIGYTAQLVAGVWVGNDDFHPMDRVSGGRIPARIWKEFMTSASQGLPLEPIPGAYPTATFGDQSALLDFYTDVLDGLQRVRRDGNPRRDRQRRWF